MSVFDSLSDPDVNYFGALWAPKLYSAVENGELRALVAMAMMLEQKFWVQSLEIMKIRSLKLQLWVWELLRD